MDIYLLPRGWLTQELSGLVSTGGL